MNADAIFSALRAAQAEDDSGLFAFYEKLLRLREAHKAYLSVPGTQQFHNDSPSSRLLAWDALAIEADPFSRWAAELAVQWDERDPGASDELGALAPAALLAAAREWYATGSSGLGSVIDALLSNALAPYLEKVAAALREDIPQGWNEPACPVCGGWPDMARHQERKARFHAICERCSTEWTITRHACFFCDESESDQLGFYSSDDDLYRVNVCDTCGHFLKVINDRVAARQSYRPNLAIERLLTPGLDVTAAQEGYTHPLLLNNRAKSEE